MKIARVERVDDTVFCAQYRAEHDRCQICGKPIYGFMGGELHHLSAGSRKSDEACAVIMACVRYGSTLGCHHAIHSGNQERNLTAYQVNTAKRDFDPDNWDPVRLAILWNGENASPDSLVFEPLPEWVLAERRKYGVPT